MQANITDTIVATDTREEGVKAVYALHDQGNAAKLVGPFDNGRFLALDLDAPVTDITDALVDAGMSATEAQDAALRYVKQGS